jgi:hypothetical protein
VQGVPLFAIALRSCSWSIGMNCTPISSTCSTGTACACVEQNSRCARQRLRLWMAAGDADWRREGDLRYPSSSIPFDKYRTDVGLGLDLGVADSM